MEMLKTIGNWQVTTFKAVLEKPSYSQFKSTKGIANELETFKEELINSFLKEYVKEEYENDEND